MFTISAKDNKTIIINNSNQMVRVFLIFPGFPIKTLQVQPGGIRICIHQKELAKEVSQRDREGGWAPYSSVPNRGQWTRKGLGAR